MKKYILAIISMLLISCGAGTNDRHEKLAGNYQYIGESGTKRYIMSSNLSHQKVIRSIVKDFTYNDNFILVEQHPNFKSHVAELTDDIWDHKGDISSFKIMADSILRNDKRYKLIFEHNINYWIISVSTDTMYGPLTKPNYINLKKQLKIPPNLLLDFEK